MDKRIIVLKILTIALLNVVFLVKSHAQVSQMDEILKLQSRIGKGWNTWNTGSVLSHVLLPSYLALDLQLYDSRTGECLQNALIGRQSNNRGEVEKIEQGIRSYNGDYTDLIIEWNGIKVRIESSSKDEVLYLLITPIQYSESAYLKIKPHFIWNKSGHIQIVRDEIIASHQPNKLKFCVSGKVDYDIEDGSCVYVSLQEKISISSGPLFDIESVEAIMQSARDKLEADFFQHEDYFDIYEPMQNVLAWNTIYEPNQKQVFSLVSQAWSEIWKGFMLPVWDTYFAAYMLSFDNKDLAYSNILAVTSNLSKAGFIPNITTGYGKTEDRSQPPVGSFVVHEIYRNYGEKWLLQATFDNLLSWNRWWDESRSYDGFLCWGTTPYDTTNVNANLAYGINELQGALYESGLDNSPMYDSITFDKEKNLMLLADVGLMSLYIVDCNSLADIAIELDKPIIAGELRLRADKYSANLQKLWSEEHGIFLNKRLDNYLFSDKLSPTLFYPLFARAATKKQAERMISEHFYNPDEFWGKYIMPSIARSDPSFNDNHYFRGRIWPPMNFLVYLGLRNYHIGNSCEDMAAISKEMLLQTWQQKGDVYENYNATTGEGFDIGSSQKSYYWGALLGFMSFFENGLVVAPKMPVNTN